MTPCPDCGNVAVSKYMKIVINRCYGGFGVSDEGIARLIELGVTLDDWFYKNRNNPFLIQMVEELGEKANTDYSKLKIIEIPDNIDWEIVGIGGMEKVEEVHRSWS